MQRFQLITYNMLCLQRLLSHQTICAAQRQELRSIAISSYLSQKTTSGAHASSTPKPIDQKQKQQQKITLIAQNQNLSITTLEEAQKLAKRRELHLLRLDETEAKTGRVMYKLVTAAEMLADDSGDHRSSSTSIADKNSKKSEKSLTIGARIADHDLSSRLKNITKWLAKRHEVRILIQANRNDENSERIVKAIEQAINEPQVIGRIVQKRSKGALIKFSILPIAPPSEATAKES